MVIWVLLIEHFGSAFVAFEMWAKVLLKVCCFDFEVVETVDLDCIAEVDGIWCRLGIERTEGFAQTELCTTTWLSLKAFTF